MATAVLDIDYLSAYLSIPQQTLTSVVDAPTAQLVQAVLEAVTIKARQHDELAADKWRVDVELENAVRSAETRIEGLRSSVEKAQKTVEELRTQLKEEGISLASWVLSATGVNCLYQKMPGHLSRVNFKISNRPLPLQPRRLRPCERE